MSIEIKSHKPVKYEDARFMENRLSEIDKKNLMI